MDHEGPTGHALLAVLLSHTTDRVVTPEQRLDRYIAILEALKPSNLDSLREIVADDVRFSDPFHDVSGRETMVEIFERMFADVADLRFQAVRRSASIDHGFFSWLLEGSLSGRPWRVSGVTEVTFRPDDGRIAAHIDHWDAASQLYERFPLIGWLLRHLRRRIAARG